MSTPFEVLETPDVPANSSIVVPLRTVRRQMTARLFYGWWIVAVCLVAGLFGNALGLYGAGVYLHSIIGSKGWLPGAVSGAVTSFYLVSALLLVPVGSAISRCGPRPVMALGACAMAGGVAWIGHVAELWQAYAAFMMMGIGWACLSTTAVATTLAPWFEHYQGRAVSIASLGASAGGMAGAPVLLFGIRSIGFAATTTTAALVSFVILLPLFWFVLRRRPQDVGAFPDGAGVGGAAAFAGRPKWTRNDALRTAALRSVVVSFGIGMMVQVGFLTHQVTLLSTRLGPWGTSATVSMTAIAALGGRLALARFADRINQRTIAAIVLAMAAGALGALALSPTPAVFIGASTLFGVTVGNVTTLSPIIVRREFGSASFGAIYGIASCGIQLAAAFGPSFYGVLHDAFDGYRFPLLLAGLMDVVAAIIVRSAPERDRRSGPPGSC